MVFVVDNAPKEMFDSSVRVITNKKGQGSYVTVPGMENYRPPSCVRDAFYDCKKVPISYYKAEAANEKAVLIGCSGLKSDYPISEEDIIALNEAGISILWIALPNPKRSVGFVPYFKQAGFKLLTNPPHDIQKWIDKDVPKIFFGHSTGGQIFFHLMEEDKTFKRIIETCSGSILSAPYMLPASASSYLDPRTYIFSAQSWLRGDLLPSETPEGRFWMKGSDFDLSNTSDKVYTLPAYCQIRELWKSGAEAIKASLKPNSNIRKTDMPILILSGKKDKASCHHTNRYLARKLKLAFHTSVARHCPISENESTRNIFIESILRMANGTFREFAEENGLYEYKHENLLRQIARESKQLLFSYLSAARKPTESADKPLSEFPLTPHRISGNAVTIQTPHHERMPPPHSPANNLQNPHHY